MIDQVFNTIITFLFAKFVFNDVPHAAGIGNNVDAMVILYHATWIKPEKILTEGLVPPRPYPVARWVANALGIKHINMEWFKKASKGGLFWDEAYGSGGTVIREPKSLFFYASKHPPSPEYYDPILLPLGQFAIGMVHSSGSTLTIDEIRERLFADVEHIVAVRIPGNWITNVEPGFVEWLVDMQKRGERLDMDIEVARPIPPSYIKSMEQRSMT